MNRLARVQRLWLARRLFLLGGTALVAAGAVGTQIVRLRLDPNGAAVHGVALLVTVLVAVILARLLAIHLTGPDSGASSGELHAHRDSVREAPLVAVVGSVVALFMVTATPRLVPEERAPRGAALAYRIPGIEHAPVPAAPSAAPVPAEVRPSRPTAWIPESTLASMSSTFARPPEINYRGTQDPQPFQDPDHSRSDSILRVRPETPVLPPIHVGAGGMVAIVTGAVDVSGDSGRFQLDLDSVRGSQRFEAGADITAEFALTPESALKIMYSGVAIVEHGRLSEDASFGGVSGAAGDEFEFGMTWSHLYVALAKRLTGHSRGSWFDFSVHAGAIIDHTLTEFEAAGVEAESAEGERGWFSPGVGFSLAVRGPGPAGFVLEFVQSVPVNLGGQAISLTDVRTGLTADIAEGVCLFAGYRYVRGMYRTYEDSLAREDGQTAADLVMRGPIFGLDFRF
jgi:hypothetical protein